MIYHIQKQKDELLKFYSAKAITEHHVLWKPKLQQLHIMLYKWFMIKHFEEAPISKLMLTKKG
jgi:hypothetical protein